MGTQRPIGDLRKGAIVGMQPVRYLVLDVESVADGKLVKQVRYPGEDLDARDAVARYRKELLAERDSDFVPYTYQIPVAVVVAKLTADCQLIDIVALDDGRFRPHVMVDKFWRGWEAYQRPTLVTFNGRAFDLPLLELAAFRYGISLAGWFDFQAKAYQQRRNRYNVESHLDLHDLLTNFGAVRFSGGLNLAAQLLGKPGKMDVQGHMVQDLFDQGRIREVNNYCRCDVLDTYFVFLRANVLMGRIALGQEQQLIQAAKAWLADRQGEQPAYRDYLQKWGDWPNPWLDAPAEADGTAAADGDVAGPV